MTSRSLSTLVLGAVAGAGLGAGALVLVRRGGTCGAGAAADGAANLSAPSSRGPRRTDAPDGATSAVGTPLTDGGSSAALAALATRGPADGRVSYRDPKRRLEQAVQRDRNDPGVVHLAPVAVGAGASESGSSGGGREVGSIPVRAAPVDVLTRFLFGDLRRFLANYRPCETPTPDTVGGRAVIRVRWCNTNTAGGPSRAVWLDPGSRTLLGFEDRAADGHLIRELGFVVGLSAADEAGFVPAPPPPPPGSPSVRARPAATLSSRSVPDFFEFVRRVEIPLYEPAELPPGFARSEYGYRATLETGLPARFAWIGYDEGVLQMNLLVAPPEEMTRIEAWARAASVARGGATPAVEPAAPTTCATMPDDTPEEVLEEGQIVVRVRSDGCRIVLRRDDLEGASVILVGSAAMPREAYVRTIRNLVPVRAPAPPPVPASPDADPKRR